MNFSIEHIQKSYRRKRVLTDISFTAHGGECVGILGSNGCGKSTLLKILAGIGRPDKGSFKCDGAELFDNSKLRASVIGYVPQNTPLIEELTAKDNLRLWYDRDSMNRQLSGGVLSLLGINEFLKVPVWKMSGGMKKRLAIGCAVAHDPPLLLLDEPSAALDLICKESIADYLKKHKLRGGVVFLCTHDISELDLCDSLYIMKNGILEPFTYDGDIHRLVGSLL